MQGSRAPKEFLLSICAASCFLVRGQWPLRNDSSSEQNCSSQSTGNRQPLVHQQIPPCLRGVGVQIDRARIRVTGMWRSSIFSYAWYIKLKEINPPNPCSFSQRQTHSTGLVKHIPSRLCDSFRWFQALRWGECAHWTWVSSFRNIRHGLYICEPVSQGKSFH